MVHLSRLLLLLILAAGFASCSLTKKFRSSDASDSETKAIHASVQTHTKALIKSYEKGDYQGARQELDIAKGILSQLDLKSDAEKIDYLDRHFAPLRWQYSFAIIAEDLALPDNTSSSEPAGAEIASINGLGTMIDPSMNAADTSALPAPAENTISNSPVSLDSSTFDDDIIDKADVKSARSDFVSKNSFDRELHNFIQQEIREVAIHMGEPENFKLPNDFVKEIEHYIRRYQNEAKYREFFQRALRRSRKYTPVLKHYFTEKGFPEEIMYLAFVESGFNPAAKSRSNAVGMFQFIKSTGKIYGLAINRWTDERYSPTKSAVACREYMHDLLLELGSFTLALSSYNSGAGKTRQALRQLDDFKDRSFWALREKTNVLKHETREYIPQIFATIVMAKPGNPPKFGFEDVPFPDRSVYRTVLVPRQMSLKLIAGAGNITVQDLLALNPDLDPGATVTPSRVLDYPLFVPAGSERNINLYVNSYFKRTGKPAAESKPRLSSKSVSSSGSDAGRGGDSYTYDDRSSKTASGNSSGSNSRSGSSSGGSGSNGSSKSYIEYTVQSGNTYTQIADWFGTSIDKLESWNTHLTARGIQPGDIVYIKETEYYWSIKYHKISKGETISTIADRYGVKMEDLRAWNGLSNDTIVAGSTLVLYIQQGGGSSDPKTAQTSRATAAPSRGISDASGKVLVQQTISSGETFAYRVAPGNTLSDIAGLFGVSVNQVMVWNKLETTRINPGQRLKIVSGKNMKFYKYKVSGGENLSDIASRFNASVQTIMIVNGKNSDTINKNEVLSIFSI